MVVGRVTYREQVSNASDESVRVDETAMSTGWWSYRLRLGKYLCPELDWQVARCQQIDGDTQQSFEFNLQTAEVKQRGSGKRVNQQVNVTAIRILAMHDRTEHARIDRLIPCCGFAHRASS